MNENHVLTNVDYETRTAICSICGPTRIRLKKVKQYQSRQCYRVWVDSVKRFRAKSEAYRKNKSELRKSARLAAKAMGINEPHRKHTKMTCERCGFKAIHRCQIDGHHKDYNHKNNDESNIESLCAMCHRIEHLPPAERLIVMATKTPTASPNGLESKGMEFKGAAGFDELVGLKTLPITQNQLPLLKKLAERESQLKEMTASYEECYERNQNFTIDLGNLSDEVDRVAGFTEDDKVRYWRDRALVAEKQLKGKTNEFDQG